MKKCDYMYRCGVKPAGLAVKSSSGLTCGFSHYVEESGFPGIFDDPGCSPHFQPA